MRRLLTKHMKGEDIEEEVNKSPLKRKMTIGKLNNVLKKKKKGIHPPFK